MTFSDYMDYLRGKRIGVIGFGVSNQPLVRVLLRSGCDVTVCDRRERAQLGAAGDEAAAQGAKLPIQGWVDRITMWFVPVAAALAKPVTNCSWLSLPASAACASAQRPSATFSRVAVRFSGATYEFAASCSWPSVVRTVVDSVSAPMLRSARST